MPTKHPTIALEEGDNVEIVPIKFIVSGVPDDISINELKSEMLSVLKRILLRLAEGIDELKVTNVEEEVVLSRHLLWKLLHSRALEQDVEAYFDVSVVRHDDILFAPIIIEGIRNSYDDVISQIQ